MKFERISSYDEFWPHYLREHAQPRTRHWHFLGTSLALLGLAGFALTRRPGFLVGALMGGYGPAWLAHFLIEKNKPATLDYISWSLLSDLRMFSTWLNGRLPAELIKAGVPHVNR